MRPQLPRHVRGRLRGVNARRGWGCTRPGRGRAGRGWSAVPGYCRAPDRASTAGRPGTGNRPVSFCRFPLQDGSRLQAWLWHTGHKRRVRSCPSACTGSISHPAASGSDGKFTACLQPDVAASTFSRASSYKNADSCTLPPEATPSSRAKNQECREACGTSTGQEVSSVSLEPSSTASGPVAKAWSPRSAPTSWLKSALGALQQRDPGLQRHQTQLRALEQLAQQLHRESLLLPPRVPTSCHSCIAAFDIPGPPVPHSMPACLPCVPSPPLLARKSQLPGPEESQTFSTICGRPDTAMVLAQGPISATLDANPKPPASQIPSADRSE
ncbi:THAP domain-containing protein 8 [Psammomys obesus]|uniref:THAP domain-containing protein 8 n=1 Tax=Psammomys obesus TaxID=48139 RepID=UPI0024532E3B|nr:THAP domain-containing protein 8 [Psammomys obesus]